MRGKRPPTSRTKRPEKGDELTYYLKRGRVDSYYLQRVQESPREARGPRQVVLCGLQPKSASETRPREFRPSDSAAATNDKTVRKNISQAEIEMLQ